MKQYVDNLLEKVKHSVMDSPLTEQAGRWLHAVQQGQGPWYLKAASQLPLAPHILGPLMVFGRYVKGSRVDLPQKGVPRDTIMSMLEFYRNFDLDGRTGKVFAYYYSAGPEVEKLASDAYLMYLKENALDPTVTPSVMALENEVIEISKSHVHGGKDVVGSFTSGGTESIILAVKTARNRARKLHPEIREPEMILPITAHAAFHKAAEYLGVKKVMVDVNPQTFRADPQKMEAAITDNTILLVASAPSYAHGVVDPIRDIGRIASERDILFHVDACVGGFLLHHMKNLGAAVPDYDFSVPGVTSLSMDLHKFGYTAKGASVVLYKDRHLRKYQFFACSGWTGYTIINPGVQSSRSGGPVAAAWAVLNYLGRDGYERLAKVIMDGTRVFLEGIRDIPELDVMGTPHMNMIGVTSDTVDVYHLADEMKKLGWYIQPQFGLGEYRRNVHFSIQASNVPHIPALLKDLKKAVASAKFLPQSDLAERMVAKYGHLQPADLTDELFWEIMQAAGIKGTDIPERMAEVNSVLNAFSPAMTDELLTRYYNEINKYNG